MSIRILADVISMDLPADRKAALYPLANWSDDEGGNIWPSMARYGRAIGEDASQDALRRRGQRWVKILAAEGFLFVDEEVPGRPKKYRLNVEKIRAMGCDTGVTPGVSPASHVTVEGGCDTQVSQGCDTQVSPNPSVSVSEEEEELLFPPTPRCPTYGVTDLIRAYNEIVATHCPNVGKINVVSDKLREKVRLRLREHPEKEFWEDRERGVLWLIRHNTFLRGDVKDWHVTPSWLFKNSDNCSKIVNGDYAKNHRPPAVRRPEPQPETPMMSEEERQRSLEKFREKAQEAGLA